MTAWTEPHIEATLEIELGERTLSWLHDVNPYEWEPEAFASIPGIGDEQAEYLLDSFLTMNNTTDEECRHCGRTIKLENDGWIDPEATGDDSIWREVCDAHDSFQANHEPVTEVTT